MRKSFRFKLQNGLNALYYPPMSPQIPQLIQRCTLRTQARFGHEMPFMFAVKVEIEDEYLYLMYLTLDSQPATVLNDLATEMQCLNKNCAIIHNNTIHLPNEPANKALVNAIVNKLKPGLAMLVMS
jgi:hypothetical protein